MHNHRSKAQRIWPAALAGLLATMAAATAATEDFCTAAAPVALNTSLRIPGWEGTTVFEIEVPASGILTLDVAARGSGPVEPKLGFLGRSCAGPEAPGEAFTYLKRSPTSLVLAVAVPGTYRARVAAQDPLLALGEYQLRTGFAERPIHRRGACGLKDEDDDEDEPNPDPMPAQPDACESLAAAFALKDEDDDEDEPNPDPMPAQLDPCGSLAAAFALKDEDDDEDEPNPDPMPLHRFDSSGVPIALRRELNSICQRGEADDHGDILVCATPVCPGREVGGEIGNGWGDDQDVFVFVLTEPQTVELVTTGPTDTFGGLYDRYGHRLGWDDDGGEGDNFRLVKTLSPGRYFVRVEGHNGAEGLYSFHMAVSGW